MDKRAPERRFAVPRGSWGIVEYAVTASGKYQAEDFLVVQLIRDLGKTNGEKVRRRLIAIFEDISRYGDSRRLEHKRGEIYGIKHEAFRKLIRFACFMDGKCWVLTHGFYKPGAQKKRGPWPNSELDRAERIMTEHKKQFRNGT